MTSIPMASWSSVRARDSSLSGTASSNPAGDMGPGVCFECSVMSGRSLCDGLIPKNPTECLRCVTEYYEAQQ